MVTDLQQFHDAFFEESLEAVDDMETGLLNLDPSNTDIESINTIFRAAHSIKGCSATFGFADISDFVHVMETVLDEMRDGTLAATKALVDLLLKALDLLRIMLVSTRDGDDIDKENIKITHDELKSVLENDSSSNKSDNAQNSDSDIDDNHEAAEWEICFSPDMGILTTGNDPLRMFSVLSELGELSAEVDTSGLLDYRVFDPLDCYLSWKLTLKGLVTKDKIREVFEWVEDECEITITPTAASQKPAPQSSEHLSKKDSVSDSQGTSNTLDQEKAPISSTGGDSASIRVGIDKVDAIINIVGELVITQSMLDQLGGQFSDDIAKSAQFEKLKDGLTQLERNTRELQESVMRIRMLPISYVFNRVPRIVHDLSKKLNKEVNVEMTGESTELDKTVMEKIGDPLVHLIRNALDHGIESPQERRDKGKPEHGTILLNAYHKAGNIIVEIHDDGAGLNKDKIIEKARNKNLIDDPESVSDEQISDLIFHPGLSTAEKVSDVSGRGVGMDVVKKNIKALGGNIEVRSKDGLGACFTIRLPLTLAILDGQLVRIGSETYIIPLISIIESAQIDPAKITKVSGQAEIYKLYDDYIPFIRLHDMFGLEVDANKKELMVVVEGDGKQAGLIVDELLTQQQVVIKSLETNFKRVNGLSGATILGNGTVALIVDVPGLIELSHSNIKDTVAA